jgi:hypothetical protein
MGSIPAYLLEFDYYLNKIPYLRSFYWLKIWSRSRLHWRGHQWCKIRQAPYRISRAKNIWYSSFYTIQLKIVFSIPYSSSAHVWFYIGLKILFVPPSPLKILFFPPPLKRKYLPLTALFAPFLQFLQLFALLTSFFPLSFLFLPYFNVSPFLLFPFILFAPKWRGPISLIHRILPWLKNNKSNTSLYTEAQHFWQGFQVVTNPITSGDNSISTGTHR